MGLKEWFTTAEIIVLEPKKEEHHSPGRMFNRSSESRPRPLKSVQGFGYEKAGRYQQLESMLRTNVARFPQAEINDHDKSHQTDMETWDTVPEAPRTSIEQVLKNGSQDQTASDAEMKIFRLKAALEIAIAERDNFEDAYECEKRAHQETNLKKHKYFNQLAEASINATNAIDDNYFKQRVLDLKYKIQRFIVLRHWVTLPNDANGVQLKNYEFLKITSRDWKRLSTTRESFEHLIEAYVWRYLRREVFSDDVGLRGESRRYTAKLFPALNDTLKSREDAECTERTLWYQWLAATASLQQTLSKVNGEYDIEIEDITRTLQGKLAGLTVEVLNHQQITELVIAAVELDFTFQRQKAIYSFFPRLGASSSSKTLTSFDPKTMDLAYANSDYDPQKVEGNLSIVLLPGLCKNGDEDGKNYDKELLLLKAEVQVSPPSSTSSSSASTGSSEYLDQPEARAKKYLEQNQLSGTFRPLAGTQPYTPTKGKQPLVAPTDNKVTRTMSCARATTRPRSKLTNPYFNESPA